MSGIKKDVLAILNRPELNTFTIKFEMGQAMAIIEALDDAVRLSDDDHDNWRDRDDSKKRELKDARDALYYQYRKLLDERIRVCDTLDPVQEK